MTASIFQSSLFETPTEISGYPYTEEPVCILGLEYSLKQGEQHSLSNNRHWCWVCLKGAKIENIGRGERH